jgi:hypothetical protein
MKSKDMQIAIFVILGVVLGAAALYVYPMQEASASLVNINGNKVLSNNKNKGNDNKNCVALC